MFEKRVLGRATDLTGMKWQESAENCIMRGFIIYNYSSPKLFKK
jgi:hypothetical protein